MTPQDIPNLVARGISNVKATKSVLSPLLYFSGILTLGCFWGIANAPPQYIGYFVIALFTEYAFVLLFYAYFAFRDPGRLQSEQHNENMAWLAAKPQDNRGPMLDITPTANNAVAASTSGSTVQTQLPPSMPQNPAGGTP